MLNSKSYWNGRFMENWDEKNGREQTSFFTRVAINHLPSWFNNFTKEKKLSICDVGCAEGDGVPILSEVFTENKITGVDFSEEAIKKAREFYPNHHFEVDDIENLHEDYDVLFVSNVLEHFHKPFDTVLKTLEKTNHFFIMMVPYQEYERYDEHFVTFDDFYVPTTIGNALEVSMFL